MNGRRCRIIEVPTGLLDEGPDVAGVGSVESPFRPTLALTGESQLVWVEALGVRWPVSPTRQEGPL